MPRLSDTMEEGAISTWHKHPGDEVAVGDVLVEIETDKAVMEYEAYQAGTLAEILVPEGRSADIGAAIALLDDGAGSPAPSVPAASPQTESPERAVSSPEPPAVTESVAQAPAAVTAAGTAITGANGSENGSVNEGGRPVASPLVRKLARENHLDLAHVRGSGPGGRIIRADIADLLATGTQAPAQAAAPAPAPAPAATPAVEPAVAPAAPGAAEAAAAKATAPEADEVRGTRGVPISQVRRVIARRLSASAREIPDFYVTAVADAQELVDLRTTLNAQLTEAGRAKVSVNDLLIRACALALRAHPDVNVSYGGDETTAKAADAVRASA